MARRSPALETFDMNATVAANFARPPMEDGMLARAVGNAMANIGNSLAKLAAASEARQTAGEVQAAADQGARDAMAAVPVEGAAPQGAPPQPGLSSPAMPPPGSEAAGLIRRFEGFRPTPYWDVNAHRIGFGSDTVTTPDGRVVKVTPGMTVSRADAERDLARRSAEFAAGAAKQVGAERWAALPGNIQAALTSVAYNYGSLPSRILPAVKSGDAAQIAAAVRGLSSDNKGVNASRRAIEAGVIEGRTMAGSGNPVRPSLAPLQLRRDGTPQGAAYDDALVKAGAFRADAALNAGLSHLADDFAADPAGFDKGAAKLRSDYLGVFRDVPEMQARAEAEFELRMQPVRNRIADKAAKAVEDGMKREAGTAVLAQRDALEKQAYGIGVQADGDARLSALLKQGLNVIDRAEEAGALTLEGAAREREALAGTMVQARFDGVFDALPGIAEKKAFAEKIAAPEMRDELLKQLPLQDYRKLTERYAVLARKADGEDDASLRMERQRYARLIDDDVASMAASGKGVAIDAGEVARIFGPAETEKWLASRAEAGQIFAATDGMAKMTGEQIGSRLAALEPVAGTEGFASRQRVLAKAAATADALLKLRADDPARAADEAFALDPDASPADLARARMDGQAALGIPELARQPLTNAEAKRQAERLKLYQDDGEALTQATERMVQENLSAFGPLGDEVTAQVLRQNGLTKETSALMAAALRKASQGEMLPQSGLRVIDQAQSRDAADRAMRGEKPVVAGAPNRMEAFKLATRPKPKKAVPNAAQVELLRTNPQLIGPAFDEMYGAGAAEQFIKPPGSETRHRRLPDGGWETIYEDGWIETVAPDGTISGRPGP